MRTLRRLLTVGALLGCGAALPAFAAPEAVQGPTRVRAGPGALHAQVAVLPAGTAVKVLERRGAWLRVEAGGAKGWVSSHALATGGGKARGLEALRGATPLSKVSPTVVVAATKGAFSSKYAARHGGDAKAATAAGAPTPKKLEAFSSDLKDGPDRTDEAAAFVGGLRLPPPPDPALEDLLGEALAARMAAEGLQRDPGLVAYVNLVGARVAAASPRNDLRFAFRVLRSDGVEAFAAPGGHVFISRGALARMEDEAELAGLLGHEVAHVVLQHGLGDFKRVEQRVRVGAAFDELEAETGGAEIAEVGDLEAFADHAFDACRKGRSVRDEQEADALGVAFAAAAGYDAAGLERFFERLRGKGAEGYGTRQGTHLPLGKRVEALRRLRDKAGLEGGSREEGRFRREAGRLR